MEPNHWHGLCYIGYCDWTPGQESLWLIYNPLRITLHAIRNISYLYSVLEHTTYHKTMHTGSVYIYNTWKHKLTEDRRRSPAPTERALPGNAERSNRWTARRTGRGPSAYWWKRRRSGRWSLRCWGRDWRVPRGSGGYRTVGSGWCSVRDYRRYAAGPALGWWESSRREESLSSPTPTVAIDYRYVYAI